jgi:hypothetical protein
MSSSKKKVKKLKQPELLTVDKKNFVAAVQALTIFHQDKTDTYIAIRDDLGPEHAATAQLEEELDTLASIISFLSDLIQNQNVKGSQHFN